MRHMLFIAPTVLFMVGCSGCDSDNTGSVDGGAVVVDSGAGDAGSRDTGRPPIVPADHPILGTWTINERPSEDFPFALGFYRDGTIFTFHQENSCEAQTMGSWRIEGNQLFLGMAGQEPTPGEFTIEGDTLSVSTPNGMQMVMTRKTPGCDQPADIDAPPPQRIPMEVFSGTWKLAGDTMAGHILTPVGGYARSDNVARCEMTELGTWSMDDRGITLRIGDNAVALTVVPQENGSLNITHPDGTEEVWERLEGACEAREVDFDLPGTWTTVPEGGRSLAFAGSGHAYEVTDVAGCALGTQFSFNLSGVPPILTLLPPQAGNPDDPENQEDLVTPEFYAFESIDENRFKLTDGEGVETIYVRSDQHCEQVQSQFAIRGTWVTADAGFTAPALAFDASRGGAFITDVAACALGSTYNFSLTDQPSLLELVYPEGDEMTVAVYEFEAAGETAFRISKDGTTWTFRRHDQDCLENAPGPEELNFPIEGTWAQEGSPSAGLALRRGEGTNMGNFLTDLGQCTGDQTFSFMLLAEGPTLEIFVDNNGEMDRRTYAFRAADNNRFVISREGEELTYVRTRATCHAGGGQEPGELDYPITGTWSPNVDGQRHLAFSRDERGGFGTELTALERCVRAASFSFRLNANPPTLERIYADENGEVQVRRHAFQRVNDRRFIITVDGQAITYDKTNTNCHNGGGGPPQQQDLDPEQVVGTWMLQGGTNGYAFAPNLTHRVLSTVEGCVSAQSGTYEIGGNLITLSYGPGERPEFLMGEMPDSNTLRFTDDNQQVRTFARVRTNCHSR